MQINRASLIRGLLLAVIIMVVAQIWAVFFLVNSGDQNQNYGLGVPEVQAFLDTGWGPWMDEPIEPGLPAGLEPGGGSFEGTGVTGTWEDPKTGSWEEDPSTAGTTQWTWDDKDECEATKGILKDVDGKVKCILLAQAFILQVPIMGRYTIPAGQGFGGYVSYFYNFAVAIGGILAVVMLMVGGVIWLTSAGSAERIGQAKGFIAAAIAGLILIFCSYIILRTVNPQLVNLDLPGLEIPKPIEMSSGMCAWAQGSCPTSFIASSNEKKCGSRPEDKNICCCLACQIENGSCKYDWQCCKPGESYIKFEGEKQIPEMWVSHKLVCNEQWGDKCRPIGQEGDACKEDDDCDQAAGLKCDTAGLNECIPPHGLSYNSWCDQSADCQTYCCCDRIVAKDVCLKGSECPVIKLVSNGCKSP